MEEITAPSVFDELEQDRTRFEYATVGQRFVNFIIDILAYYLFDLLMLFIAGILIAFSGKSAEEITAVFSNRLVLYAFFLADHLIFYTVIEGITKGRSLGKLVTGTKAVKEDLSPITWKDAFIRTLCRLIPFDALSAFSGHPWHDSVSKTYVIKNRQTGY